MAESTDPHKQIPAMGNAGIGQETLDVFLIQG